MIRTKMGPFGLCAIVLGLMAMSASSAQAKLFKWSILDKAGSTATELKAALAGKSDGDITLVTHLLKRLFWITCTSFELENGNLEALGLVTTGFRIHYTGCEAYGKGPLTEPLGCSVQSPKQSVGLLRTNELKGELLLHEPEAGKTELVVKIPDFTLEIITDGCIMPTNNPVKGEVYIKDCMKQAEEHKVKHLIESVKSLTKLNVGSVTAEHLETWVEGSGFVELAGAHAGLLWSGLHGKA